MIKHLLLSLSFILTALYSTAFSQTGWFCQNPLPQGNSLTNISFVDESLVYVSGFGGTLMKSTNGGVNFSVINTGFQENLSVEFVNANTGFSYGIFTNTNNGFLRTLDGGTSWQYYSVSGDYIRQLLYVNESNMYLIMVTSVVNESDINTIYKSTDLGQTCNSVFQVQQNARINSIYFINQLTGFAVGRKLAVPQGNISKIYKTTNGGVVWDSISSNMSYELKNIFFTDNNTAYATGTRIGSQRYGIFKTTNSCVSWDTSFASSNIAELNRIKFFNQNEGYVYGSRLLTTTNGGLNWVLSDSYYTTRLINITDGIGIRDNFIYKTTNAGNNWQTITQGFSDDGLEDIYFLDENTGFTGGNNRILKTTNSGLTWEADTLGISTHLHVENIKFVNNSTGYAGTSNDVIAKTTNTGESWVIYNVAPGAHIHGLNFPSVDTGYIVTKGGSHFKTINGGLNWVSLRYDPEEFGDVCFINNTTGFSCGGSNNLRRGVINRTTNGGLNWNKLLTDSNTYFWDAYVSSPLIWYAAGQTNSFAGNGGVIYRSTDMGLTWEIQHLPDQIFAIHFPSQNTGYASSTGKIYKTTNGGGGWFPTYCVNTTATYGIYFVNENTGWGVGYDSKIFKTTTGGGGLIGIEPISAEIPRAFVLKQNYPNPFNPQTKINFDLPKLTYAELTIYDILGRQVSVLVSEHLTAGKYSVDFDGSNMPSGVYFYRLKTGDFSESRKMILIK